LLHETGLEDYYRIRERIGDGGAVRTAVFTDGADALEFIHLDEPDVQSQIGDRPGRARLHLTGVSCPACVWLIERLPASIEGLESARVELASGRIDVEWSPGVTRLSEIASALDRFGYRLHVEDESAAAARREQARGDLIRLAVAGASAGNVMLISFALHAGSFAGRTIEPNMRSFLEWAALVLAAPAVTHGAWPFYRGVIEGLRRRQLHLDLPVSLGILGSTVGSVIATLTSSGAGAGTGALTGLTWSAGGSYFDSVTALVFLLLVGRWVQGRGQRWAASEWGLLQRLLPPTSERALPGGGWERVAATRLQPGDRVRVSVGGVIPADGRVFQGRSGVDQSMLSGEATPRSVDVGHLVLAGTRNLDAPLQLEVLEAGDRTRAAALVREIGAAQFERPAVRRQVDQISAWFAGAVVVVAVLAGLAWMSIDSTRAFSVVVSILVVSCPCALGLATPTAIAVARGRAARSGISLASTATLERLGEVERVVFDKTGTLTDGRAVVQAASTALSAWEAEIGLLEGRSSHPLAGALRRWSGSAPDAGVSVEAWHEHPGRGIDAAIGDRRFRIGAPAWLGVDADHPRFGTEIRRATASGWSPVVVEVDGQARGVLAVGDRIRPEARAVVEALRGMGMKVEIASGDHPDTVATVAARLGIQHARGGLGPSEKIAVVQAAPGTAMVGDGVNDAAAMRAASVAIAVRGATDVAVGVADVHPLRGDALLGLPRLFEGARATLRVVRRNLGISATYNVVFAGAAAVGWVNPLAAAILMPLSSLSVIALAHAGGGFRGVGTDEQASAPQDLPTRNLTTNPVGP
jgi:Cu2+-exporting ATPase